MNVMNVLDIFWHIWAIIQKGLTYPRTMNLMIQITRYLHAKESRVFRAIQMVSSRLYSNNDCFIFSAHECYLQHTNKCVNAVRSCMSKLTFHLLQPQLQISFTDDLRRENASRICMCFTYVAEFIFHPRV